MWKRPEFGGLKLMWPCRGEFQASVNPLWCSTWRGAVLCVGSTTDCGLCLGLRQCSSTLVILNRCCSKGILKGSPDVPDSPRILSLTSRWLEGNVMRRGKLGDSASVQSPWCCWHLTVELVRWSRFLKSMGEEEIFRSANTKEFSSILQNFSFEFRPRERATISLLDQNCSTFSFLLNLLFFVSFVPSWFYIFEKFRPIGHFN